MSLSLEFLYETIPVIDLLPVAVLMNKGRFKGTNLAWLLGYTDTARVNQWFRSKDYDRLISYIHTKKDRFLEFYRYLRQEMPLIWAQHTPLAGNAKVAKSASSFPPAFQ